MTFRKSTPPVGARPGTLAIPKGSPPPAIRLVEYDAHELLERPVDDVESLAEARGGRRTVWIDVRGLGDERVLRRLGELFAIHPLALEDAVNVPQRAGVKLYDEHQVIVARCPVLGENGAIEVPQVCFVLGARHLITLQERPFGFFDPVRERLRAGLGPIRRLGPDYLAYALVDSLVDRYYPIAQQLSEELEELEEEVVEQPVEDVLTRIHRVRRRLVVIRRVGGPQREALAALARDHTPFVSEEVRVFLRDTLDHSSQILELVDSCREMCVGLMEIHLSHVSQRTNEVMKVLTLMASIFIPLSFLAGLYGMNFDHIPGVHHRSAFGFLVGTMATMALAMLWYFRRRGWLGRGGGGS